MSIERIRKLLSMTVERGCTEAEALAAAEKAARLMAELGLTPGDVTMDASRKGSRYAATSVRARLWNMIATCTNTAWIFVRTGDGDEIEFIGATPGPEVAVYLYTLTNRAIDRELRAFKATAGYRRRTLKNRRRAADEFTFGMVVRLSRRLRDLFSNTVSTAAQAVAVAERDRRYSDAKEAESRPVRLRSHKAIEAGFDAASAVSLNHGVGSNGPPAQPLLGRS